MIDKLRHLKRREMITIDNDTCFQFTTQEDFTIDKIENTKSDSERVTVVTMGDYYLIGTEVDGDEKFAVCEIYDEGSEYLDRDETSFLDEIKLEGGEGSISYNFNNMPLDMGAECAFCEYETDEDFRNYLLVHRTPDFTVVYRGVVIEEENIVI